ncbi:MAG TPA: ankyrin repeat domain-containing protein, partial [Gammaproteobacteria bacterium]|nr:ankyrin repeat domain-containing protein [Gammaproteobacteria bacterium]
MPLQENEERLFSILEIKDQETRLQELHITLNELTFDENINCKNRRGHTPLWMAVEYNDSESLKLLIEAKANTSDKNFCGFSALMLAIRLEHADCAAFLIANGADLNAETQPPFTYFNAWELAIQNKDFFIVKLLLEKKVKVTSIHVLIHYIFENHATEYLQLLLANDPSRDCANRIFEGAALYGDVDVISQVIHRIPVDILRVGLEYAMNANHFEIVEKIEKHLHLAEEDIENIIRVAIEKNNVVYLRQVKREVFKKLNLKEMFSIAAANNNTFALKKLLVMKVDVDNIFAGKSALVSAISSKAQNSIKFLLEHKADANLPSAGEVPLIHAINDNFQDGVKLLLNSKANPNAASYYMKRICGTQFPAAPLPLRVAMRKNNIPIIQLLMDHKATFTPQDAGKAFKEIVELGYVECVEYLIDAKADLSKMSKKFEPKPYVNLLKFAECVSVINDALETEKLKHPKTNYFTRVLKINEPDEKTLLITRKQT